MRETAEKIMHDYGQTMLLCRANGTKQEFRGFLQRTGSRTWQNLVMGMSPLGKIPGGQFQFIGPLEPGFQEGDTLIAKGESYDLRQLETVMLGNEKLYCWGLCVRKGGEDTWGSRS